MLPRITFLQNNKYTTVFIPHYGAKLQECESKLNSGGTMKCRMTKQTYNLYESVQWLNISRHVCMPIVFC